MPGIWGDIAIPVFGITGPNGVGKTLLASSIDPANTLNIDCELSSASYSGIPYKRRIDLYEELEKAGKKEPTPTEAFECWKGLIEAVKPGEYTVIITDTWDFISNGLHDWVEKRPEMFGKTAGQYAKMSGLIYGDMAIWLHNFTCAQIRRTKIETFVFIHHEGNAWEDSKMTNKKKTKGGGGPGGVVFKLASLFLNLERKPDQNGKVSPVPSGYTVDTHRGKCRLVRTTIVDGEVHHQPILPPRIPEATPKAIRELIRKPVDWSKLKKEHMLPEIKMTADERLELEAQRASDIKQAQEYKFGRAQLMAEAAKRLQRKPGVATTPATPAATTPVAPQPENPNPAPVATTAEPKQEAAKEAPPKDATTTVATEPQNDSGAKQEASGAADAPFDSTSEKKPVRQVIAEQLAEMQSLGVTPAQCEAIIGKRKKADGTASKTLEDLTDAQAEELRQSCWDWLTKKKSSPK